MSTPQQVAANLRKRMLRMKDALRNAEGETLRQAKRQAVALSSGPYSTADLRRMGHPYGHGRTPPMDSGVINAQRRVFLQAWSGRLGTYSGDRLKSSLVNASDVARFMRGTSKMIARPIWKQIGATIRPIRRAKLRAALRRALHG